MKKFFFLMLIAIFAVSCSKKVDVKGVISGGSPLERIEFIESTGIATLPLTNIGIDKNGRFTGSFTAPKNGMYVITYGGKQGAIYLKGGQNINISGNGSDFPTNYVLTGDGKNNNEFLKETQKFLEQYASKVNMGQLIAKDETSFLKEAQKIYDDLDKNTDETAKKHNADSDVIQWKKDDLKTSILGLLSQYEVNHAQAIQNPNFKISKNFTDYQNKMMADNDRLVENHPVYRNFLLGKMSADFQKFAMAEVKTKDATTSETFVKFLATQKNLSQTTKDYLLGYVIAQSDIHPGATKQSDDKISKIIDTNIKNEEVKNDLKKILFVINGLKTGDQLPETSLVKADGSKFNFSDLKGKPTLVMFYASWNPYITESSIPVLKEVVNFYKSKMNFAYVNLDDTKEQFGKTSSAMLKGLPGTNVYAEGGLNSDLAQKAGIYGFKLPGFLVLNKDGKIEGKYFVNLGDPEIVTVLNKVSGLTAPQVAQPMPQMMPGMQQAPPPAAQTAPQPAGK